MNPKVRGIYFRLERLLEQIPSSKEQYRIDQSIVESYHQAIDELGPLINESLDGYKVSHSNREDGWGTKGDKVLWLTDAVKTQIGSLIGYLEGVYSFNEGLVSNSSTLSPSVTVINNTTIAVTINQTISQLVEKATNKEEKEKLLELEQELEKPTKNWDKIKDILVWCANFSKDLFFQLLPIILKHYGLAQ